jgi:hypothetical protein
VRSLGVSYFIHILLKVSTVRTHSLQTPLAEMLPQKKAEIFVADLTFLDNSSRNDKLVFGKYITGH